MRMLLPKKSVRDLNGNGNTQELTETLDPDRAEALQAERQASTRALGSRQEQLSGSLEEMARLAGYLRNLEQMVGDFRAPFLQELSAHKQDHGELITTRAILEQTAERLGLSRERERALAAQVANLEVRLSELVDERQHREGLFQDAAVELDRTRTSLAETEGRAESAAAALRDAQVRGKQLEEDIAFLRKQGQEDDSFRREVDALLARASQEALLLEEEAATLRRRLSHSTQEALRLTDIEAELQAQLAAERARMIPLQAAVEQAGAEVLQVRTQAEEQGTAARSEAAALNTRLETSNARANRLESLNADLARRLSEATSKHRVDERRANEVFTAGERAAERAAALEEELSGARNSNAAVERARLTALERADQLAKLVQNHELTIRRAEERMRQMQARLDAGAAELEDLRSAAEQRAQGAGAEIQRLRADLAIAEAGLQSAREDRQHRGAYEPRVA